MADTPLQVIRPENAKSDALLASVKEYPYDALFSPPPYSHPARYNIASSAPLPAKATRPSLHSSTPRTTPDGLELGPKPVLERQTSVLKPSAAAASAALQSGYFFLSPSSTPSS